MASARHLESQLRDVSGGNSSSAEKWFYLSETFGMRADKLLAGKITHVIPIVKVLELADSYFENKPVSLKVNKKTITNETVAFSLGTFIAAQKILSIVLADSKLRRQIPKVTGRSVEELLEILTKFASRTEFLLTLKPFTYEQWVESFLQANLPENNPIAQMLMTVFKNDVVKKYYLGPGEKRLKKP